ncbi:GYP8 [Sanghuangporus weigelae]
MTDVKEENEKIAGISTKARETNKDILSAIQGRDWSRLRSLSVRPGGFGEDRIYVWPFLLHVEQDDNPVKEEDETDSVSSPMRRRRGRISPSRASNEKLSVDRASESSPCSTGAESHPDERQIKLDTDRSFVLYGSYYLQEDEETVEFLQAKLNSLITSVFRKYPQLSYFQGYHDIISVLYLTLPEEEQLACAEKMSLHRLRDAMGKGLEPLLGLLHILKYLLRLIDADYAALLERNTPLPYFALSNLLTFFSHDVPTLPLIQHVFDFLLCRPPITVVYLVASITLSHRDEAFRMETEGEEGMLHSLLSSLPRLSDGDKTSDFDLDEQICNSNVLDDDLVKPICADSDSIDGPQEVLQQEPGTDSIYPEGPEFEPTDTESIAKQTVLERTTGQYDIVLPSSGIFPDASKTLESAESSTGIRTDSESSVQVDELHSTIVQGPSNLSHLSLSDIKSSESPTTEISSRPPSPRHHAPSDLAPRKIVALPALLEHADELFERYPPSNPALHVSEIMGPKSVIFTWSEDPHSLMSDAEAEAVMAHPELIVLPFIDPDEVAATKEAEEAEEASNGGRIGRKFRRQLRRKHFGVRLDKKTVFTGTVVTLSVAVAVYSIRSKGNGGVLDVSRSDKTLRKAARVVSGILIGGSERLLETFGW